MTARRTRRVATWLLVGTACAVGPATLVACNAILGIDEPAAVGDASITSGAATDANRAADVSDVGGDVGDVSVEAHAGSGDGGQGATCSCAQCCAASDAGALLDPSFECQMTQSIAAPWTLIIDAAADGNASNVSGGIDHDLYDGDGGPFASCGPDEAWLFCGDPSCTMGVTLSVQQVVQLDVGTSYTLAADLFRVYTQNTDFAGFLGARDLATGDVLAETAYAGSAVYERVETHFTTGASGSVVIYAGYSIEGPQDTSLRVDNFTLGADTASDP